MGVISFCEARIIEVRIKPLNREERDTTPAVKQEADLEVSNALSVIRKVRNSGFPLRASRSVTDSAPVFLIDEAQVRKEVVR